MKKIRMTINSFLGRTTKIFYDNPIKTIIGLVLFISPLMINMPKIKTDTSIESFLHSNDPKLITYETFKERFGNDLLIFLSIESENIFSIQFLDNLKKLHNEIAKETPYVEEVTSLINVRNTYSENDNLIVEDLITDFPENEIEIEALKKQVLGNPIYTNMIISEDGTFTTLIIKIANERKGIRDSGWESDIAGFESFTNKKTESLKKIKNDKTNNLSNAEYQILIETLEPIMKKYEDKNFKIRIAGTPSISYYLQKTIGSDMGKFVFISLLVIVFIMAIMFRRISGVFIPLTIIILSILTTVGSMALLGVPIQLSTQILPSYLCAVIIGATIHALSGFYKELKGTNKRDAIINSFSHTALPICMTSLTTAVGLIAFTTADLAPITNFGYFGSLGVLAGLLYTLILIPALIAILPIKKKLSNRSKKLSDFMDKILLSISHFSINHAKSIIALGIIAIICSASLITKVKFSHNEILWVPEDSPIRKATTLIDQKLKGTTTVEVIIDTKKEEGVKKRDFVMKLEEVAEELTKYKDNEIFVGKTFSVNDIIKEVNRALDNEFKIPGSDSLVSRNYLLFENSGTDDMEKIVDVQYSLCRFTIKLPWVDAIKYNDFLDKVESIFKGKFGDSAEITMTGTTAIIGATLKSVIYSTAKSLIIAILMISIMMILLIGNFKMGIISMVPNLFPIVSGLGIMVIMSIPLDMATMMIANIVIGLAVDDSIHFFHNFRNYYIEYNNTVIAINKTFLAIGRAMVTTSVILSLGFFMYTLSDLSFLWNFGFLTGLLIIIALASDFFIGTALTTQFYRKSDNQKSKDIDVKTEHIKETDESSLTQFV